MGSGFSFDDLSLGRRTPRTLLLMDAGSPAHPPPRRCIVSLGITTPLPADHPPARRSFAPALQRLRASLDEHGFDGDVLVWDHTFPAGAPPHENAPFAFKPFCIQEAESHGCTSVLWMDASVVVRAPLDPLFEQIERDGYLIFAEDHSVGAFCKDDALEPLGLTREDSFALPSCWACVLGLDLRREVARRFLRAWKNFATDGVTFPGPKWSGVKGFPRTASCDPRVLGHRYDQTVASVLAHRLGMTNWQTKETFAQFFQNDRRSTYRPRQRALPGAG